MLVLLLTSSAFRLVLSSFLITAREIMAAVASDVEDVAGKVYAGAEQVERVAKLGDVNLVVNEVQSAVQETIEDVGDAKVKWTEFVDVNADRDRVKDIVLTRIQEVSICATAIFCSDTFHIKGNPPCTTKPEVPSIHAKYSPHLP